MLKISLTDVEISLSTKNIENRRRNFLTSSLQDV